MERYHCNLCEYDWESRIPTKPISCPRCKRYEWYLPITTKEASKPSEAESPSSSKLETKRFKIEFERGQE